MLVLRKEVSIDQWPHDASARRFRACHVSKVHEVSGDELGYGVLHRREMAADLEKIMQLFYMAFSSAWMHRSGIWNLPAEGRY